MLLIDEGVLGHRTLRGLLENGLGGAPDVELEVATIPEPSRIERVLLRRVPPLGDADLHGLRWRLRWSWQGRRLLRGRGGAVDVALINTQAAALLARGPMRRLPCALSVDSTVGQFTALAYQGPPDRWTPAQLRANRRFERRAFAGAAAVLAWTDHVAAAIRAEYGLPEDRLATFHPGIDVAWWAQAAREREPGPAGGPLRVLFVGNDVERKGLGTLIAAVERLGDAAALEVVTGDEVAAGAQVRVHHGLRPGTTELRDRFAAADVYVLPTYADAVPWGVLEAMAAGLPVISTAVGSIPELVGEAGDLIEPGDAAALARALERLVDPGLRKSRGAAALARARERYDSATQIPRLEALLRDAASFGRPRR